MRASWMAVVAAALMAAPAAAQPGSPLMYCVPGTPFGCFGMEFTMSGTTGTFWLQNLQGSATGDPTPFSIGTIGVHRRNPSTGGLPTEQIVWSFAVADGAPVGAVKLEPGGGEPMAEDSYAETPQDVVQDRLYFADTPDTGLYGCSLPPGEWVPGDYIGQTCPVAGFDGWWRMTFTAYVFDPVTAAFTRELLPGDVAFRIGGAGGCVVRGASSGIDEGERGPDCLVSPYPGFTTIPEPGTLALLGGGLGVFGLVGWRRRVRAG